MSDLDHHDNLVDQKTLQDAAAGCEESQLLINRRTLMGLSASLFTWAYMPRVARAEAGNETRLLVVLLRGGMDGLSVVLPMLDKSKYDEYRGALALTPGNTLGLNGDYRLTGLMPNLHRMYAAGDAALVQAVAPPLRNRSHFECQYNLEAGSWNTDERRGNTGWMNRLLSVMPMGSAVEANGLAVGRPPLILAGKQPILGWSPGINADVSSPVVDKFTNTLSSLYGSKDQQITGIDPVLGDQLRKGIAIDKVATMNFDKSIDTPLKKAFAGTASLLQSPAGPRIGVLDIDGWDTHVLQTRVLDAKLKELDDSLEIFRKTSGQSWNRTVVLCVTEFGRTVRPNGTGGSDHGVGTFAFLAGGAVAGGKVHGSWPGLAKLLIDRDLDATTDIRQLFKGVLHEHLQVSDSDLAKIFPNCVDTATGKDGVPRLQGLIKRYA